MTTNQEFPCSKAELLSAATLFFDLFNADHVAFETYSTQRFPADYCESGRALVAQAYTMKTDEEIVSNQAVMTRILKESEKEFRHLHRGLKPFIEAIFLKEPEKLGSFGINTLAKSLGSINNFIVYLSTFDTLIKQYAVQLKNAGCPDVLLTSISKLLKTCMDTHSNREVEKVKRLGSTAGRRTLLNEIWAIMVQIHQAAKFIYYGNELKIAQFDLPRYTPKPPITPPSDKAS